MGGVSIISGTLLKECVGNHFRPQNNYAYIIVDCLRKQYTIVCFLCQV